MIGMESRASWRRAAERRFRKDRKRSIPSPPAVRRPFLRFANQQSDTRGVAFGAVPMPLFERFDLVIRAGCPMWRMSA
ncbi:MAG: hypothetical protein CME06_01510, partial [Gemmatimonadetes bacterium]|nr:hypothetical protein [Gemmatimonadota bacterium]